MFVTCLPAECERRVIEVVARRAMQRTQHFDTYDDAFGFAFDKRPQKVVVDIGRLSREMALEVAQRRRATGNCFALHVVHDLDGDAIDALLGFSTHCPGIRETFRRYHDLGNCVAADDTASTSATLALLGRLQGKAQDELERAIARLVALGERPISKAVVAAELGVSQKRLDALLQSGGLPRFTQVMRFVRVLHATYRDEMLTWPDAAIASAGGWIDSPKAMRKFIARNSKRAPGSIVANPGFGRLSDEFSAWFVTRPVTLRAG